MADATPPIRSAEEAIRHVIASYNIAGDARQADDFLSQFARDAVLEFAGYPPLPGFRCEGHQAISDWVSGWRTLAQQDGLYAAPLKVMHHITTSRIDVTGPDSARARSYFLVYTRIGPDHCGVYSDRFAREDEAWRLIHRSITLSWRADNSVFPPVAAKTG